MVTEVSVVDGILSEADRQQAITALRKDGIVVLANAVDPTHIATVRDKMLADVAQLQSRTDAPYNWNSGNIQQDPPPFPPYLFNDILVNEHAIAVAKELLGPGMKNWFYSGNTAVKSTQRQPVHADTGQLWRGMETPTPAFCLVVNFPMVDMSATNGSTEVWLGSHLDTTVSHHDNIEVPADILEARRAVCPPLQPTVKAGSIVIRDIRLWHAGMPNHTDQPRPMIALIFSTSWYNSTPLRFPKGTEEFFQHPDLHTHATFVEGEIDYIRAPQAYAYEGK